jgi:hypothetical protein
MGKGNVGKQAAVITNYFVDKIFYKVYDTVK